MHIIYRDAGHKRYGYIARSLGVPYGVGISSLIHHRPAFVGVGEPEDTNAIARFRPRLAAVREATERQSVYVAVHGEEIVGFVMWRERRDKRHTIYDIATAPNYTRQGVKAALLNAVPRPRQLKCTVDNPANEFYT